MDLQIAEKAALVTGASAGLGLAVARALADEGVCVAISSRSESWSNGAAALIGERAVPLVCDLSDPIARFGFVAADRRSFRHEPVRSNQRRIAYAAAHRLHTRACDAGFPHYARAFRRDGGARATYADRDRLWTRLAGPWISWIEKSRYRV